MEHRLGPIDRGIGLVRQVATPAVLLGAGIALTLVLGRGRMRNLLGGGMALAGLALRWRSTAPILAPVLAGILARIRRSAGHGDATPGTSASRIHTR